MLGAGDHVEVFAYSDAHIARIEKDILFIALSPRAAGQGASPQAPAWTRSGRLFQKQRSIMSFRVNDADGNTHKPGAAEHCASPAGSSISLHPARS
jgi:hypothetical protein